MAEYCVYVQYNLGFCACVRPEVPKLRPVVLFLTCRWLMVPVSKISGMIMLCVMLSAYVSLDQPGRLSSFCVRAFYHIRGGKCRLYSLSNCPRSLRPLRSDCQARLK